MWDKKIRKKQKITIEQDKMLMEIQILGLEWPHVLPNG